MEEDIQNQTPEPEASPSVPPTPPAAPARETLIKKKRPLTKKAKIAIATGVVVVCAAVGTALSGYRKQVARPVSTTTPVPTTLASSTPTPTPTPTLLPSNLNGTLVPQGQENVHPLAVMIENHPDARPQAGLGQADIVYEAIAEGGITRFMAVFGNPAASIRVGPVRSARPYYVDYATELKAIYAHAGGSQDALTQIQTTGVLDVDGLNLASIFKRDYSRNVSLEHTLFSSTDSIWKYATETRNWSKTGNYQPWLFQDDAAADKRPAAQKVSVSVSDPLYAVSWTYDPTTNFYLRSMAGTPHNDANTGKQIAAKNVILQTVQRENYTESYGSITKPVSRMFITGTGSATIFQNGMAIKATWKKSGTDRTRYYDADGKEIQLVRGEIWIQLVHPESTISY